MRKGFILLLIALSGAGWCPAARSQTSAEINQLLQKSKLVDTGRPVNASIRANCVIVSTYADPKARNEDCKITALLMMKELRQHFKRINRIQVLFFDQIDTTKYREVTIREGDARLIDAGKPPSVVLAKIAVHNQRTAPKTGATATSKTIPGSSHRFGSATPQQGSPMMKEMIMRVANTYHLSNSAEAIWARHMTGKSAQAQITRSERTALYRDLRDQMARNVSPDKKDQALFSLHTAFTLLGGVDD